MPATEVNFAAKKTQELLQKVESNKINYETQALPTSEILTNTQLTNLSNKYDVEVPVILTLIDVISNKSPFYEKGKPTIIFSESLFSKFSNHKYDKTHPEISKRGMFFTQGLDYKLEKYKYSIAYELAPTNTMKATYWGMFKTPGYLYNSCGFKDVASFVSNISESNLNQVDCYLKLLVFNDEIKYVKNKNWEQFIKSKIGVKALNSSVVSNLASSYSKFLDTYYQK